MANPDKASAAAPRERRDGDRRLSAAADARLRALDAMLGGVAHDLNNALSVVLMNLDVMQQDPAVMGKHGRRVDGMLDAMTGASALVRHLLSFSHSRRPEPEIISIIDVLPSLIDLLEVAIGREVEIASDIGDVGPCCVRVDPAGFEVAVVHAAMQLAATMPGGGLITFALRPAAATDGEVVLSLEAEPRGTQPENRRREMELDVVEHFARDALGSLSVITDAARHRVEIRLPACAESMTA
jgi:hypothetical protein